VRFAPSPTGPFSLGNARTALFNWLFAKHEGGEFLLRIEDTDKERSQKKFENDILDCLTWLGLNWSNGIYRQSERLAIYEEVLRKLIEEKKAYYCFCKPEELETERQVQLSQGLPPRYSGRCRNLDEEETAKRLKNEPTVIRLKVGEREISFSDLIRGKVNFDTRLIGDIIIAKSFSQPLYNFAVVVDDAEMKISHVIRGEDHLSNTPKQLLVHEAIGLTAPEYAHLPLILGPNRKKLSKRYSDKSFGDYHREGYLREAMLNFLVLLGWHPEQDREVMSLEEMIAEFGLKRVQKAGAVFNPQKLDWLNAFYVKKLAVDDLADRLKPFVPAKWLENEELFRRAADVERERMKTLSDFPRLARFFFEPQDYEPGTLIWNKTAKETILENLKEILKILKKLSDKDFSKSSIEKEIMALAREKGNGETLWPLRVALSGQEASPGPLDIIHVLGIKECIKRIELAIDKLEI